MVEASGETLRTEIADKIELCREAGKSPGGRREAGIGGGYWQGSRLREEARRPGRIESVGETSRSDEVDEIAPSRTGNVEMAGTETVGREGERGWRDRGRHV